MGPVRVVVVVRPSAATTAAREGRRTRGGAPGDRHREREAYMYN